jgi:hypothetical protein
MKKGLTFLLLLVLLAVFSGCAGTAPTAEFKSPIDSINRLCNIDELNVKVAAADGVLLNDISRQRLESVLLQTINEKKKNAQCKATEKRSFVLNSKITRYEEGNAFARAMLAGLGQIHLDGEFVLLKLMLEKSQVLAEFNVSKTFAWGGVYGGSTRIEDVEPAFAEGVAAAIVVDASDKKD